ncbi:hypothetical protein EVAR_50419_1 [Eumeta japonica]|uniref:Uncharacterized protein n=1 Tax=Eumeta variegata TaxID=151549 RepID=A0A4C1WY29_EUMVA|nr:hypothetical protein EVAR_50419_1 [Eumeta japonica]
MVNATHGHSQHQRSHHCVADPLGRNRISNGEKLGILERERTQLYTYLMPGEQWSLGIFIKMLIIDFPVYS